MPTSFGGTAEESALGSLPVWRLCKGHLSLCQCLLEFSLYTGSTVLASPPGVKADENSESEAGWSPIARPGLKNTNKSWVWWIML